jgi:uncharacterized protein YbbC (DUF1343 family)
MPTVLCGLDELTRRGFAELRDQRVGLVTHPAAVTQNLRGAVEVLAAAPGVQLAALFGPEHGFTGEAQDLEGVSGGRTHPRYGVPVLSLYGDTFASLKPTPDQLRGLDALLIDLQDVGSRYYTFQATMLYCLEAAAAVGLKSVYVLDRPNPIGGEVEGPTIRPGFESFVGAHPIPTRHGLTVGELARLYLNERGISLDVAIIPCGGWQRSMDWDETGRFWLPPSPNMPAVTTAVVYPGMCLIEGTSLSEGRGTTRPFEYVGFPGVDPHRIADHLNGDSLPGVRFLPVEFRPTFQKHAGKTCGGVLVAVTDRSAFRPVRTGLAVVEGFRALLGDAFRWRTERYEFVDDKPAIDLLFGSDRERQAIEAGVRWREIAAAWEPEEAAFRERRKDYLLYPARRSP